MASIGLSESENLDEGAVSKLGHLSILRLNSI